MQKILEKIIKSRNNIYIYILTSAAVNLKSEKMWMQMFEKIYIKYLEKKSFKKTEE